MSPHRPARSSPRPFDLAAGSIPSFGPRRTAITAITGITAITAITAIAGLACVPTVRTPLKQALPSVLGAEAAGAPLCYGDPLVIDIGGASTTAVAGTIADFDGDRRPDLALATSGPGGHAVTFAINDGNGGLRLTTGLKFPMTPTAIEAADLDHDGALDLAIAATPAAGSRDDAAVHVLLGRGQGQFIAGAVPTRVRPVGLWLADFTGDGVTDILALDERGREVELLIGDGRGEYRPGPRSKLPGKVAPEGLTVGDFDLDKQLDLAMLYDRGGKAEAIVAVARGDGRGEFKLAARRAIGRHGRALVAADFNSDGLADLTALAESAGDGATSIAAVLLGDGALGFTAIGYFGPAAVADAIVTDVDRNAGPDLLTTSGDALHVLRGDGRGGFAQGVPITTGAPRQIARAADLDGDGRPELVTFGRQAAGVTVLRPRPCR